MFFFHTDQIMNIVKRFVHEWTRSFVVSINVKIKVLLTSPSASFSGLDPLFNGENPLFFMLKTEYFQDVLRDLRILYDYGLQFDYSCFQGIIFLSFLYIIGDWEVISSETGRLEIR